jgi:peptidoglycan/xylan/chitin deacetylase (PgdA/CDA1 family)
MTKREKPKVPILLYHSISSNVALRFKKFCVSPELFEKHMTYLAEYGFDTITVTQYAKIINSGTDKLLPKNPILLTFDDGFADFYSNALPILEKYQFTATLYVATAFVNTTSRWLTREGESKRMMLNWEQIVEINSKGIECGTHSHSHLQLDTQPLNVVNYEIVHSKRVMEERIAQKVESFAYPFGYFTPEVRRIIKQEGYTSACAVRYTLSAITDDPFSLARILITSNTDLKRFATLITKGNSQFMTASRQIRTMVWQLLRQLNARFILHKKGMARNNGDDR